jgi:serine/threonine protein phosphatase PrpC
MLVPGVFDGLGGHPNGAAAARAAAAHLRAAAAHCMTACDLLMFLEGAVRATGGLTTAAVAMLPRAGAGWVVSAGDSAAHVLGPGGRIEVVTPLDASSPHEVTDCLGRLRGAGHCARLRLAKGGSMLLSTDGVHRVASPAALARLLRSKDPRRDLDGLFGELAARGLPDDATALLVRRR